MSATAFAKSILYIKDDSYVAALVKREYGETISRDKVAKLRERKVQPRWRSQ